MPVILMACAFAGRRTYAVPVCTNAEGKVASVLRHQRRAPPVWQHFFPLHLHPWRMFGL